MFSLHVDFWAHISHPALEKQALRVVMSFATTYLCEAHVSAFISVKNKYQKDQDWKLLKKPWGLNYLLLHSTSNFVQRCRRTHHINMGKRGHISTIFLRLLASRWNFYSLVACTNILTSLSLCDIQGIHPRDHWLIYLGGLYNQSFSFKPSIFPLFLKMTFQSLYAFNFLTPSLGSRPVRFCCSLLKHCWNVKSQSHFVAFIFN